MDRSIRWMDKLCGDTELNHEESAEAIVPENAYDRGSGEGLNEHQNLESKKVIVCKDSRKPWKASMRGIRRNRKSIMKRRADISRNTRIRPLTTI